MKDKKLTYLGQAQLLAEIISIFVELPFVFAHGDSVCLHQILQVPECAPESGVVSSRVAENRAGVRVCSVLNEEFQRLGTQTLEEKKMKLFKGRGMHWKLLLHILCTPLARCRGVSVRWFLALTSTPHSSMRKFITSRFPNLAA